MVPGLDYPLANFLNWLIDPLKRFWSPGRPPPPLSYCQNVQNDHPLGSDPAPES